MNEQPEPVLQAVLTRTSALQLTEPAPTRAEVEELLEAAATAADHGRLLPWRLIAITGEDRARLGTALAEAAVTHEQARRAATGPLRAPLLLAIILQPVPDHPKVPEWEQLAAVVGMVTTMSLLLHARGWGSIWRTGPAVAAPQVLKYLGLDDDERLLGWLYIGTRPRAERSVRRPRVETSDRITWR